MSDLQQITLILFLLVLVAAQHGSYEYRIDKAVATGAVITTAVMFIAS